MAEIAVKPYVLKNATIQIDSDDFAAAVSSVVIQPTSTQLVFQGAKPSAKFTDVTPATWALVITFAQDWETAGSLSNYLLTNEGQVKSAEIYPEAGGTGFELDIIITPGQIGGDVATIQTATVTLGVQGKPTIII